MSQVQKEICLRLIYLQLIGSQWKTCLFPAIRQQRNKQRNPYRDPGKNAVDCILNIVTSKMIIAEFVDGQRNILGNNVKIVACLKNNRKTTKQQRILGLLKHWLSHLNSMKIWACSHKNHTPFHDVVPGAPLLIFLEIATALNCSMLAAQSQL